MKYKLRKKYSEAKAFPLPKELRADGNKMSASILSKQSPRFLKSFQNNVAIGDYYGLTKHPDSEETADSKNWKDMLGGEPGTLGRYHMNQIRRMNDEEMSVDFNKELPILPGALNFSENKVVKNQVRYKLKKLYKESLTTDDIDTMKLASKNLPKSKDLNLIQAFTTVSDTERLLSDLPTAKSSWWRGQLGGKYHIDRHKVGQIRRMNDGEDDGTFVNDLNSVPGFTGKIIPGALSGATKTDPLLFLRSESKMKYRLRKADKLYMEGYKAALRDMYREEQDLTDFAKDVRDSKKYSNYLMPGDLSFAQDVADRADYNGKKYAFSKEFKWKDNQARRMNDGEFAEPSIYDPEYDYIMGLELPKKK